MNATGIVTERIGVDIVTVDGIATRFEVTGSGPALLMYSPGGFDSSLENWTSFSIYKRLNLIEHLSKKYTCIRFDRRESGLSGGRVEIVDWNDYVRQGKGLLDHLGISHSHLMGGCVGCSSVLAFADQFPKMVLSMILFSPAGGPKYRMNQNARLSTHASFAQEFGLEKVVELARSHGKSFSQDPRIGPWAPVIRSNQDFATEYVAMDLERYLSVIGGMVRTLFDKDTVPGPNPEQLMQLDIPALIVPGQDTSHAPSAARYLQECLPNNQYWDMPVAQQTEENTPQRVIEFLDSIDQ